MKTELKVVFHEKISNLPSKSYFFPFFLSPFSPFLFPMIMKRGKLFSVLKMGGRIHEKKNISSKKVS